MHQARGILQIPYYKIVPVLRTSSTPAFATPSQQPPRTLSVPTPNDLVPLSQYSTHFDCSKSTSYTPAQVELSTLNFFNCQSRAGTVTSIPTYINTHIPSEANRSLTYPLLRMEMGQDVIVPAGVWVCCYCGTSNLFAIAPEKCPVCSHTYHSSHCKGPGARINQGRTLFPDGRNAPTSNSHGFAPSALSMPRSRYSMLAYGSHATRPFDQGLKVHQQIGPPPRRSRMPHATAFAKGMIPIASCSGGYEDNWTCPECEWENNDWHEHCPNCGTPKPEPSE